jgi:hypothetical protein
MLDAFEIYEHTLGELIEKKSAQIAKLAKTMTKLTGKTKKSKLSF